MSVLIQSPNRYNLKTTRRLWDAQDEQGSHFATIIWLYYHHQHLPTCLPACLPTYLHTCLLLFISMLWHRQAIFESKGDKLSSSAECRIRISSRLDAHWQTNWAIEDQAKYLNPTARPYDQRAFSPLDPTAGCAFAPGSGCYKSHLVKKHNIYKYMY